VNDGYRPMVSIILPVLNEELHIERCLRSLINNTYSPNMVEILVMDGGSSDSTRRIVSKIACEDSRVRLIDNPRTILAAGINIGIENARGDVLIRMDGHAEASDDFIEKNIEVLNEHPDAWCVGGSITTVNNKYIGKAIAAAMSCPVGVGNAKFRIGNYEGYADTVAYGAYRKEVFEKVGKLDERLLRTEDDDLHFRLRKAGGKIYLSRKIRSSYFSRSGLVGLWRQYFQYGFWRIPTIFKHRKPAAVRQVVPVIFVLGCIVTILATLLWQSAKYLLAAYLGLYLMVLLIGGVFAIRHNGLAVGIATPFVFPILHFAYGIGSLAGIWHFVIRKGK
jgi:glycosyltransferase involved in cell wall biosynthesis